eukprot:scaffold131771_cov69-Phaeocystis_antarctica.AAC.3
MASGVSMEKSVVCTPFLRPSAVYASFSGSAYRLAAGKPTCSQNSRPRSGVPMPTARSLHSASSSRGLTSRAS